jgi:hypothetical protein
LPVFSFPWWVHWIQKNILWEGAWFHSQKCT